MKKIQIILILIIGFVNLGLSQRLIKTDSLNYIRIGELRLEFMILDSINDLNIDLLTVPKYSLGEIHLENYLRSSFKFPNDILEDTTINFDVFEAELEASFIIDKTGNVIDSKIKKGFNESADNNIINTLNRLKEFDPGKYNTKEIDIKLIINIKYQTW